jgi:Skp family chaperone for outer membrane proteins
VKALLPVAAATVALLNVVATAPTAQAQAPNPAGANTQRYHIAVVDIGYIFKNHKRHQDAIEKMKSEMSSTEAELKSDSEKIRQMEEQRNSFKVGTKEYKDLDEELARNIADFKLKMDRLRKDFMDREAQMYYQTYLEVSEAIKYYAQRHDIALVLRFNGDKVDPARREDVQRAINSSVVFQNQIDITPDILALINRDQAGAPKVAQPPLPSSSIPH